MNVEREMATSDGLGYEVELCPKGFVVLATEDAPEREPGEVVAGAYSQRARANRVCRHLNEGWSPEEADRYEWPAGRMGSPRPLVENDGSKFLVEFTREVV